MVLMSDIDLGPVILVYLKFLILIFLSGGSFFCFLGWLLFLRKSKRQNKTIKVIALITFFVIGGIITENVVKITEQYMTRGSSQKQLDFIKQMQKDYQIVNLIRDGNIIRISYKVPSDGDYHVYVFGVSNTPDKKYSFEVGKSVIKPNYYPVSIKQGINEYAIKLSDEQLASNMFLDFDFMITPLNPTNAYKDEYWDKRFFTPNLGSFSEGMNYYSSSFYYCFTVLSNAPCKEEPLLHLKLN